jgi:hypothetical protein
VGEEVQVFLVDQKMLSFHPDDTITLHYDTRWGVTSVNEITNVVLGMDVGTRHGRVWAQCEADGVWGYFPVRQTPDREASRFKIVDNRAVYLNPVFHVTHSKKRKETNDCYKAYAAFRKYLYGVIKLRGETPRASDGYNDWGVRNQPATEFSTAEYEQNFGPKYHGLLKIQHEDMFGTPEEQYKAAMYVMYRVPFTVASAKVALNLVIDKVHRDSLFDEVVHKDGKIRKDAYGKVFID